jgi:hypothetical protein
MIVLPWKGGRLASHVHKKFTAELHSASDSLLTFSEIDFSSLLIKETREQSVLK